MTKQEIIDNIHKENVQKLITMGLALEKVLRARTLKGAKKAAKSALKKEGYL